MRKNIEINQIKPCIIFLGVVLRLFIHLLDILDAWSAYNRTCRFTNHQFFLCQFFLQQLIRSRFTELVYKEKRISAGKIYHICFFKNRLYR